MGEKTQEELEARIRELEAKLDAARVDGWAFRALAEAIPQRVFWKDRNSLYLGGNSKLARDCGYEDYRALPGKRDHDHFPKEHADFFVQCDKEVMDKGEPLLNIEEPQRRPDGSTSWLLTNKVPLRNDEDQVIGMLGTYIDVTEEKQAKAQLEAALVRAAASEAKSDFLTTVSHELRTPLTLILSPLSAALANDALPDAIRYELETMQRNGRRIKQLVDDVLDLRKGDDGMMSPTPRDIDLDKLLAELVDDMQPAAVEAGVELELVTEGNGQTRLDDLMVERIVMNLVGNAFKFTPRGGKITLQRTAMKEALVLTVTDTGPGIPEDRLERLFDRYEQGDPHRSGGTGLGLALVKQFADLLGGSVEVASELGAGTSFTVTFPRVPWLHDDAGAVERANRDPSEVLVKGHPPMEDAGPEPELAEGQVPIHMLVVEDNRDMQVHMVRQLSQLGSVKVASHGGEALEMLETFTPDVIISDVMMPEMDGLTLVKRLKNDAAYRHIPTILVTARAGQEAVAGGLDHGADDYLCKPFEPNELRARVRAAARLHRLYQEVDASRKKLREMHEQLQAATQDLLDFEAQVLVAEKLAASAPALRKAVESRKLDDEGQQALQRIVDQLP